MDLFGFSHETYNRLTYKVEGDSIMLIIVEKRGRIYQELRRRLKGSS